MTKVGWVFRVEVVTDDPTLLTKIMRSNIKRAIRQIPKVDDVLVDELYEDVKLFKKKAQKQ